MVVLVRKTRLEPAFVPSIFGEGGVRRRAPARDGIFGLCLVAYW